MPCTARMKNLAFFFALMSALACGSATRVGSVGAACPNSDAGITLPRGFCATVFADSLGSARQLVVAPNGDVFVNLQRQQRGPVSSIPAGLVALRDTNKDGRISMPEAAADPKLVEIFSAADKNGDGYLDKTEYANSTKAPPRQ